LSLDKVFSISSAKTKARIRDECVFSFFLADDLNLR